MVLRMTAAKKPRLSEKCLYTVCFDTEARATISSTPAPENPSRRKTSSPASQIAARVRSARLCSLGVGSLRPLLASLRPPMRTPDAVRTVLDAGIAGRLHQRPGRHVDWTTVGPETHAYFQD